MSVLSPQVCDERLHMPEITAEEIKRNNVPKQSRYRPHTYATSSLEAANASSEHERANIDHGKEASSGAPAIDFAHRVQ